MAYRKLISALVLATFGFCFSEAATAQDGCDNPDFCFDFGIPGAFENDTGSGVNCIIQPGGDNRLDIGTGFRTTTGTFTQNGTAECIRIDAANNTFGPETCEFNLAMAGVTLSACISNSFNASAFCQDNTLTVTGTLTCPVGSAICGTNNPCIMNFDISGMSRNRNQCETVFPAGDITGLPAGKVLDLTVRTQGPLCTGPFVGISDVKNRWCNSGDLADSPVDCTPPSGVIRRSTELAVSAVPFDFNVRQTVNTGLCRGGDIDRGTANIDIFGSNTFNVNTIDLLSLRCEGEALVCGAPTDLNRDGFLDRACQVNTCPEFGPNLVDAPQNPDGTVTATCTGRLLNTGTQILGTDDSVRIN